MVSACGETEGKSVTIPHEWGDKVVATRTLKARVEIDGEKQYKQALSELNQGNKVLASEMKKLQAEYKGNADSVDYLNKKGDLLQRQLQQQRDKVKTLQEAVAKSAQQYGEADKKTQDWIIKLNNAEAAQFDLEHAIEENNKALEGQGKEMTGLGDAVKSLTDKLGIQLPQGATNALNGMSKLSTGTVAAMGVAAAAIAAVVKTVKELQETTLEAAARADDIMTRSTQMNISAQTYQALQYASPFVDVDVDTMASSLSKLTKAMGEAAAGSEAAQASFSNLGVSIYNTDGTLRDSYDVWLDTMDALAGITNETERDIAAQDLLGKSAQDLATIYRDGTGTLREYIAAAEENYVMSDEQLAVLGSVDDAWQELQKSIENNKNMIGVEWAPTAKQALDSFNRLVTAAGKALVDSGIIKGFGELVQFTVGLLDPIASLLNSADGAPGRLQPVYEILHGIAGVLAWIADAANVAIGLVQTLTIVGAREGLQRIGTAMGYGKSTGNYSNLQRWQGYGSMDGWVYDEVTGQYMANGFNAAGTQNWRGGLTWVGESGPELVALPRGSQIYNAQDSRDMGNNTFYITIDAKNVKEFNDIVALAQSARVRQRMG